jgi:hypothetical protein
MMNWITVERCPLCECSMAMAYGQGYAPVFSNPEILGGGPMAIITRYCQCASCGLIRQSPRLDDASLEELYSSGEYRRMINNTPEAMNRDEWNRSERIAKLITSSGSHLDIGCSRGYLLRISQAAGRMVQGVEPNREYTSMEVPVVPNLNLVVAVGHPWDTITCIATLEHVPDPVDYANKITALLADGGRLILEVPSEKSKGGPLRLWHLYLFQPWVITRLFHELTLVDFQMTPDYLFILEKHG